MYTRTNVIIIVTIFFFVNVIYLQLELRNVINETETAAPSRRAGSPGFSANQADGA